MQTRTYTVVQQPPQHVLSLSRTTQKQPHGGRQQLHLQLHGGVASHSVDERFQRVGAAGNPLPIGAQQPQQRLPALVDEKLMKHLFPDRLE